MPDGTRKQPDRQTDGSRYIQTSIDGKSCSQTDGQVDGSLGAIGHSDPHGLTTVPSLEFHEPSFFKDLGIYLKDIIS